MEANQQVKLRIDNLSLSFGGVSALIDVSIEIRDKEILAIIGPNVAGKTALLNCINGFYKPQKGEIYFESQKITRMRPDKLAKLGIARTFQNIELYTGLSTQDNLMAAGEWSAFDCLKHLADTERGDFPPRIGDLLRGEDFPAFDPDRQGTVTAGDLRPSELAREFARLRWESLALLSRIGPSDLDRKARHADLGVVTLGELIHGWAGHDLMHTVQGERAILQPFIEGCGPWKPYFTDHATAKGT